MSKVTRKPIKPISIKITTQASEYGPSPPEEIKANNASPSSEKKDELVDGVTEEEELNKSDDTKKEDPKVDASCYSYEGEVCIYTDPQSKVQYTWDTQTNDWKTREAAKDYAFDGKTYLHTDQSGVRHKWNLEKNEWEVVEADEESEEDDDTTEEQKKARRYRKRLAAPGWNQGNSTKDPETGATTYKNEEDGMVYEWDADKKAWFPKMDEEFMAQYQLSYGFTKDGEPQPTMPEPEQEKPQMVEPVKKKAKQEEKQATWFNEDEHTTKKVYVSGLPSTITEESFNTIMAKCGMIEHDVRNKKPKLKIYRNAEGVPKGDGLCSYLKHESVTLAFTILDGSDFEGNTISVQPATFQMKGDAYDPKLKPRKLKKKEIEQAKKKHDKLFAWEADKLRGERTKNDRVIVIKNLFDPSDFNEDAGLILDYTNRIRKECGKFGEVSKVSLYDKHQDGVCQVFFKEPEQADMAIQMMNGRLFGKNIMSVETWDGKAKFKKVESAEEEKERLDGWEKFLNEDEMEVDDETKETKDEQKVPQL